MTIQTKNKYQTEDFENLKDKNLLEMEKAIAMIFNKALEKGNKIKGVLGIIDDVQALLEAIIQGDIQTAEKYVIKFSGLGGKDLFVEVGKITRKLHDSIREFQENINPRLKNLPVNELPEANDKLQWVIEKTEEAASRTIGLVEKHLGYQGKTSKIIGQIETIIKENKIPNDLDQDGLNFLKTMNQDLSKDLTEIMIAQDFQDLTGQIIKKVIQLIAEIENQLVMILKIFGVKLESSQEALSGPQIKKMEAVVSGQSEVDDILNQFGF
jgi:chemotaxis regulatin CheY-phosphate phosphatase CheZ